MQFEWIAPHAELGGDASLVSDGFSDHFFNPAVQLTTTVNGRVDAATVVATTKRFPAAVTSYWEAT